MKFEGITINCNAVSNPGFDGKTGLDGRENLCILNIDLKLTDDGLYDMFMQVGDSPRECIHQVAFYEKWIVNLPPILCQGKILKNLVLEQDDDYTLLYRGWLCVFKEAMLSENWKNKNFTFSIMLNPYI